MHNPSFFILSFLAAVSIVTSGCSKERVQRTSATAKKFFNRHKVIDRSGPESPTGNLARGNQTPDPTNLEDSVSLTPAPIELKSAPSEHAAALYQDAVSGNKITSDALVAVWKRSAMTESTVREVILTALTREWLSRSHLLIVRMGTEFYLVKMENRDGEWQLSDEYPIPDDADVDHIHGAIFLKDFLFYQVFETQFAKPTDVLKAFYQAASEKFGFPMPDPETKTEEDLPAILQPELEGKWTAYSNSSEGSMSVTYTFRGDMYEKTIFFFENSNGEIVKVRTNIERGKFSHQNFELNLVLDSFSLALHDEELVTSFNTAARFGFKDWTKNIAKDLTEAVGGRGPIPAKGATLFQIAKIEEGKLYLGDESAGPALTSTMRPTQYGPQVFLKQL